MRALRLSPVRLTVTVLTAAAIAVALLLLSSNSTITHATDDLGQTVETSTDYSYDFSVADTTPGAARATTTTLTVPHPGNINFANLVTFDPAATTTQGCNTSVNGGGFATAHTNAGACLTAGEVAGTLTSLTALGTLNSLCFTTFTIDFVFYSVALPNNVANPDASTNLAYTQPEGTGDRFERWGTTATVGTDIAVGAGDIVDLSSTANDDSAEVKADADNVMFKNYPQYLLDTFRDTNGDPVIPQVLYGSLNFVAGSTHVPLFFAVFAPGVLAANFSTPNPLGQATTNLGWASQTLLNDGTQTSPNPSAISSFCATTSVTSLLATVDGQDRATNPSSGTHLNLGWVASARDLDNEGIENALDTCMFDVNIDGDPRTVGGGDHDPDGDGIDSVCDANPGSFDGNQTSDTGWYNFQDNCTEETNPAQASSESSLGIAAGYAAGRADDGGSLGDGIGDQCDDGDAGPFIYNGISTTLPLSPTVANGRWAAKGFVTPICYGLTDGDNDGYCKEDADAFDTNPNRWSAWTTTAALSDVLGSTAGGSAGSWDTDHAGGDPISGGSGSPSAGFDSDWLETYVGTDADQPCALTSSLADEQDIDAWLYDVNGSGTATLGDVLGVSPFFLKPAEIDTHGGSAADHVRFDWNADGFVSLGDVLSISPVFLNKCLPVVAPQ